MTEVRISKDGALCCPWCDEEEWPCLHHGEVTVYERGEDAKHVSRHLAAISVLPAIATRNEDDPL